MSGKYQFRTHALQHHCRPCGVAANYGTMRPRDRPAARLTNDAAENHCVVSTGVFQHMVRKAARELVTTLAGTERPLCPT